MNQPLIIRGGRILDPTTGRDGVADLFIAEGRMVDHAPAGAVIIEAAGCLVTPGLLDLHVHLREPGGEENETIATGSYAAARGGFTTVVAMPNTKPSHDTAETVAFVKRRGEEAGLTRVAPSGAITLERKGKMLTDMAALQAAGAVAVTDDGSTVQDDVVMEAAMREAARLGLPLMDHAQDNLVERQGGVMHEGVMSRKFGFPGIPSSAEERIIRRDIELAARTGVRLHIQHVTSAEGAAAIREARARGLPVTGELTPHHLALCDEDIDPDNADFKMNPPLRSREDRTALIKACLDGTLSCFATDHAPHSAEKKARGFLKGPFGLVGLETAIGVTWSELVEKGLLSPRDWLVRWTVEPARILSLPSPTLAAGAPADVVVMDMTTPWTVDRAALASKSKNTPFHGRTLIGRAAATICGGKLVWLDGAHR
jgi:dihydroorotase